MEPIAEAWLFLTERKEKKQELESYRTCALQTLGGGTVLYSDDFGRKQ